MSSSDTVYMGPTVYEIAKSRLYEIDREIASLEAERAWVRKRMREHSASTMLEAERIATAMEPYQRV